MLNRIILGAIGIGASLALAGCARFVPDDATYTLYRNSAIDSLARYHIASFDAADGERYNQENCDIARQLFQSQPGVTTRFWCEKGAFRP